VSDEQPMPPGYPLPPVDGAGHRLSAGSLVTISTIPEWLKEGLTDEDIAALDAVRGSNREILRFDEYGYAWFGDRDGQEWFCLRPEEVKLCAS
jgi:hypothetical protein